MSTYSEWYVASHLYSLEQGHTLQHLTFSDLNLGWSGLMTQVHEQHDRGDERGSRPEPEL